MKIDTVTLTIKNKKYSFKIKHNMPRTFGMNIECALDNWLARTNTITPDDFCDYVKSKGFNAEIIQY